MASSPNRIVLEVAVFTLVALPVCARGAGSTEPNANAIALSQLQQHLQGAETPSTLARQTGRPWALNETASQNGVDSQTPAAGERPPSIFPESPSWTKNLTGCLPFHRRTGSGFNCRFKFFGP
jgi:hypothetical protein